MTDDLVSALREVVRDVVSRSTLRRLEGATGFTSCPVDPELSGWFAALKDSDKDHLRRIVKFAVDDTVDNVFEVLDEMSESQSTASLSGDDLGRQLDELLIRIHAVLPLGRRGLYTRSRRKEMPAGRRL